MFSTLLPLRSTYQTGQLTCRDGPIRATRAAGIGGSPVQHINPIITMMVFSSFSFNGKTEKERKKAPGPDRSTDNPIT
jgi:hypothetical protein